MVSVLLLVPTAIPSAAPAGAHPALAASGPARPTLSLGDRGPEVRAVQRIVGVAVDGRFGPRTRRAVQARQGAAGLVPDGIVGALTWGALDQGRPLLVAAKRPTRAAGPAGQTDLSLGDRGPAVAEAQKLLARAGRRTSRDGKFGPATHEAVVSFQRSRSLPSDGVVGARTWAALQSSAPPPPKAAAPPSQQWRTLGSRTHVVQPGDTLSSIASAKGGTATALAAANRMTPGARPTPGRRIQVPGRWRCPVASGRFINDWGFPRPNGRYHQGNDLFAPRGAPIQAPVSGRVERADNQIGGNAVELHGDDGNRYYFAHLDSYGAAGRVKAGSTIGYVGSSGNAATTPPHLHFEVHPGGGSAVNPYPTITLACRR